MSRKFSELADYEQTHFRHLADFMKETWNEDIGVKIDIIKRFDLDIKDPVVLDFLTDVYVPQTLQKPQKDTDELKSNLIAELQPTPPVVNEQSLLATTTETAKPVETTKKREMTYANSEDLIVIQNRLLHAISHLTLNERRLILFLSPIVRKQLNDNSNNKKFIVRVDNFMNEYGLKGGSCYLELEKTVVSIQQKIIEFWNYDKNGKIQSTVRLGWITKGEYFKDNGYIALQFHDDVIEMLTVFDKTTGNFWTQYQKEWIINLGTYGIIMLEMVLSSLENKGYYTVEHLREKFDCIETYKKFSDFKLYVINKAIKEIHKHTPIKISYETHKTGRAVTGLTFSYIDTSIKPITNQAGQDQNDDQPKEQNPFINFKMTQKQLSLFASKIKKASGQDVEEIIAELSNVHLQSKHIDFLKVLDYVPSDWYSDDEIKNHLTTKQIAQAQADKKAQAKVQEQQKQEQFRADMNKLVAHAEAFVKANLNKVAKTGIERIYLQQENYVGIVRAWERHLIDEKARKHFAMLDEILAV